jgi:pimeloyl-ACP methyl ester carboxylesterase
MAAARLRAAEALSIATFADDLLALMDHLDIARAHVGGISMGAAVTTRFAVLNPLRAQSLCIARPAWFDRAAPDNMAIFAVVSAFLEAPEDPIEEGRARFEASAPLQSAPSASPDNAKSLASAVRPARSAVDGNSCCHGWLSMGLVSRLPITARCACPCR